mmetsp:Transcript_28215/g.59739  ORF Transcript_28215/g.59739 Transcript_28215/m.59739 type:complete len:361 (-) Transcript_28215:176-1258(-)
MSRLSRLSGAMLAALTATAFGGSTPETIYLSDDYRQHLTLRRGPWVVDAAASPEVQRRSASVGLRRAGRSLQDSNHPFLDGTVVLLGRRWHCQNRCSPAHANTTTEVEEDGLDEVAPRTCHETLQTGSLGNIIDIDLGCTFMNYTNCAEITTNTTLQNWRLDLYEQCDQDENLLTGQCKLHCRFGASGNGVMRCSHQFDRHNLYGMHGGAGLHHCLIVGWCVPNSTAEAEELHCNMSTRRPAGGLPGRNNMLLVVRQAKKDNDSSSSGLTIALAVTAGILLCTVTVLAWKFRHVCAGKDGAEPSGMAPGVVNQGNGAADGVSNVVVGRPVASGDGAMGDSKATEGTAAPPPQFAGDGAGA